MRKFPCSIEEREITRQELLLLSPEKASALACAWAEKRLLSRTVTGKRETVLERFAIACRVCDAAQRGESLAALFLKSRLDYSALSAAFFHCGLLSLMPISGAIVHAWEMSKPVSEKLSHADPESTGYYLANPFTEELDRQLHAAVEKSHAMEKVTAYYLRHRMFFGHVEGE